VEVYLNIAMIIVSILLITLIIVGARNSTVGNVFGGDSPVYHARRGIERAVFSATVWVSVIFFTLAILSVLAAGSSAG
jgi:preprotein translocase subunit SecG